MNNPQGEKYFFLYFTDIYIYLLSIFAVLTLFCLNMKRVSTSFLFSLRNAFFWQLFSTGVEKVKP